MREELRQRLNKIPGVELPASKIELRPSFPLSVRDTYLVQGYTVTDPEALAQMRIPEGETVVEVPKRLMKYLPPARQPRPRPGSGT